MFSCTSTLTSTRAWIWGTNRMLSLTIRIRSPLWSRRIRSCCLRRSTFLTIGWEWFSVHDMHAYPLLFATHIFRISSGRRALLYTVCNPNGLMLDHQWLHFICNPKHTRKYNRRHSEVTRKSMMSYWNVRGQPTRQLQKEEWSESTSQSTTQRPHLQSNHQSLDSS